MIHGMDGLPVKIRVLIILVCGFGICICNVQGFFFCFRFFGPDVSKWDVSGDPDSQKER